MTTTAARRIRSIIETAVWGRTGATQSQYGRADHCRDVAREFGLVAHLGGGAIVTLQTVNRSRDRRWSDKRPVDRSIALQ